MLETEINQMIYNYTTGGVDEEEHTKKTLKGTHMKFFALVLWF